VRRVEVVLGHLRQHPLLQQQFLPAHVLTAPSPVLSRTEDGGGGSRGSWPEKEVPEDEQRNVNAMESRGEEKGVGGELSLARQPRGNYAGVSTSGEQQQGEHFSGPRGSSGRGRGAGWCGERVAGAGFYNRAGGSRRGRAVTTTNGGARWCRWPTPGLGVTSWAVGAVT
jgi:hypothetical protein